MFLCQEIWNYANAAIFPEGGAFWSTILRDKWAKMATSLLANPIRLP